MSGMGTGELGFLANAPHMILTQTNFENAALEALTNDFYKSYKQVISVEKTNFPLSQPYSSY